METKKKLFSKNFSLMIIGQIISILGNATLRFGLSLFILDKTGSVAVFGTILALSTIPTALLSPFGGVLADRVSKKWIMVVLDAVTALVIGGIALCMNMSAIIPIIAIAMVVLGVIQCFYSPSVQSAVPLLVDNSDLMTANGIVVQVNALAMLLGPILGGILYAQIGMMPLLLACVGAYAFSSAMELFITIPHIKQEKSHSSIFKTIFEDLKIGGRIMLYEKKILLKSLASITLLNLFLSSFVVVGLPALVKVYLGMSDTFTGYAQSALGVGSILGAILMSMLAKKFAPHKIYPILIFAAISIIPIIIACALSGSQMLAYALMVLGFLFIMLFCTMYSVYAQTILQQISPPQALGKISSFATTILTCSLPIGQFVYGFLFEIFDKNLSIMITGVCVICIVCAFVTKKCFDYFKTSTVEQTAEKILQNMK